ncbi:MAG: response regulator [Terriglobales bacterium]
MGSYDPTIVCRAVRKFLADQTIADLEQEALAQALSELLASKNQSNLHVVPARRRVLVVDDDPTISATTHALLAKNGFTAQLATSAGEALRIARKFEPDTLLTDIIMPGVNGVHLAQHLLRRLPDLRVIFFSGHAEGVELLNRHRQPEASVVFLPKPLDPRQLLRQLCAA